MKPGLPADQTPATLVYDHVDSRATYERLMAFHNSPGWLVAELIPPGRTLSWIAKALMTGMGRDTPEPGARKQEGLLWSFAIAWAKAMEVKHIVVVRAHLLQPNMVDELVDLAVQLSARIIFVAQPTECNRELNAGFRRRCHMRNDPDRALVDLLPPTELHRTPAESTNQSITFPDLPAVDFTTFRAVCRDQLEPMVFHQVDEQYRAGATRAVSALVADEVEEGWLIDWLRHEVDGLAAPLQTARIRGVQAGALVRGHLIKVRMERLLQVLASGGALPIWSEAVARAVRGYRNPIIAALAAVLCASQAQASDAEKMTVADVVIMGESSVMIRVGDREILVDDQSAIPIAAYTYWRRQTTSDQSAPLWVSSAATYPALSRRVMRNHLGSLSKVTGRSFTEFYRLRPKRNWASRYGLSIQELMA